MFKHICFKIILHHAVRAIGWARGCAGAGCRRRILQRLNIGRYSKRGELRIGLEVGYMPFEMIDKRSGLRQKEIRHGGLSTQRPSTQFDGF
jgi:hypothetical protein